MTADSPRQSRTRRTFLHQVGLGLLSLPAAGLLADRALSVGSLPASLPTAPKIMLIRHAEKPDNDGTGPQGVTDAGQPDPESLTVRGWQRAGALAQLFSQAGMLSEPPYSTLAQPARLFASAVGKGSPSRRPAETLTPLAGRLGLALEDPYAKTQTEVFGQMLGTAARQGGAQGPILVAWEHALIPDLARAITRQGGLIPAAWPSERFDLIWVLDWQAAGQRFVLTQVNQRLLMGDAGL